MNKEEDSDDGGHYIHAKAALRVMLIILRIISQDYMESKGWDYAKMTKNQRELFKDIHKNGRNNILKEHTRIAEEALIAG